MPKNKLINLLPQEEFESSTLGRVLHWAMGTFRIIVILTEMVVMAAFLSRFWLDAQNSELSDSIKIATSQIQVQSKFEQRFRELQAKLAIVKNVTSGTKDYDLIRLIAAKVPADITTTSILLENSSIQIIGTGKSESAIAQFVSNLKSEQIIKSADLESLSSGEDKNSINFQINISY
jgi:Tfp pilus assembly protein PilN